MEFCKATLTFECADQILIWCDHSNESSLPVLTHGAICFSKFHKMKFGNLIKIYFRLNLAVKGLIRTLEVYPSSCTEGCASKRDVGHKVSISGVSTLKGIPCWRNVHLRIISPDPGRKVSPLEGCVLLKGVGLKRGGSPIEGMFVLNRSPTWKWCRPVDCSVCDLFTFLVQYTQTLLIRILSGDIESVRMKRVKFRENVKAFISQGQRKLSVIIRCPY